MSSFKLKLIQGHHFPVSTTLAIIAMFFFSYYDARALNYPEKMKH
jgi:hypothetical protein